MKNLTEKDISLIKKGIGANKENRRFYEDYLRNLEENGKETVQIKKCVEETLSVIKSNTKRFVIYGEPQSGKTAMMIALTDRILNVGHKIVIILLNDSTRLLEQNLQRFIDSGINPTPRNAMTLHSYGEKIDDFNYILFCKKNARNLENLINMVRKKQFVVLDDEADYATPNGKINKNERSKINELVKKLVGDHNYYIGVTATPARLDLNNTLDNDNEKWVHFEPHSNYIGKNQFFLEDGHYERFWVSANEEKDLEKAAIAFMCNVAVINKYNEIKGKKQKNYCMLIHTSGRKLDHRTDKSIIDKLNKNILIRGSLKSTKYYRLFKEHVRRHPILRQIGEEPILQYLDEYISSNEVIEINSDNKQDRDTGAPPSKFTFYVGGNIVSRGVTFDNLLSMYFTRNTKTVFQQDTFIQRARMFGARKDYLDFFQLWIPEAVFLDWQHSFIYHYISLLDLQETGTAPIWTTGGRVVPTSLQSIDKKNVYTQSRIKYSEKFNILPFESDINRIINEGVARDYEKLLQLKELLPISNYIRIIIKMIELLSNNNLSNVEIIDGVRLIPKGKDVQYHDSLIRTVGGVFSGDDRKKMKKDHTVLFIKNTYGESRMIYYYGAHKVRFFQKRGVS